MAKKRLVTDVRLDTLNKVIQSCAETAEYGQQCKACGLDVEREMRENAEQLKTAEALKRQFFPDRV